VVVAWRQREEPILQTIKERDMTNQEIKMARPRCCTVCGFPTQARLQICSVACLSKHRRGRKLIRSSGGDGEFETTEGAHGEPQTMNLAES